MAAKLIKLAKAVALLSDDDYAHFKTWVGFIKALPKGAKVAVKSTKKRKYTRRAPAAVEVAPGVRVTKRGKRSAGEIDHSPRSVEEQE